MNWLEVSITVDGELAEAVSDVFARFAPNGVVTESGVRFEGHWDHGSAFGPITVRAYLPLDDAIEETRQKLQEALHYLGMIQPLPAPTYSTISDQNWMEAWKQHYRPIPVGERIIIVPAWMSTPGKTRIAIRIDPGMAFGTGTHPTTQLAMMLMEKYVPNQDDVIDVGCGSAILSFAALKLGAQRALGVDIDQASITNARENAVINQIGDELLLGVGSVKEILHGNFAFQQAPLVLANILAPVLVQLLEEGMADLVAPGGVLILSGILDVQEDTLKKAADAQQLSLLQRIQMGDWIGIAYKKT